MVVIISLVSLILVIYWIINPTSKFFFKGKNKNIITAAYVISFILLVIVLIHGIRSVLFSVLVLFSAPDTWIYYNRLNISKVLNILGYLIGFISAFYISLIVERYVKVRYKHSELIIEHWLYKGIDFLRKQKLININCINIFTSVYNYDLILVSLQTYDKIRSLLTEFIYNIEFRETKYNGIIAFIEPEDFKDSLYSVLIHMKNDGFYINGGVETKTNIYTIGHEEHLDIFISRTHEKVTFSFYFYYLDRIETDKKTLNCFLNTISDDLCYDDIDKDFDNTGLYCFSNYYQLPYEKERFSIFLNNWFSMENKLLSKYSETLKEYFGEFRF